MSASYYYARLRGDAPFDANDIEKLATALSLHPHEISRLAASYEVAEDIEPIADIGPVELSRRLKLIVAAGRGDGSPFDVSELIALLAARGVSLEQDAWAELLAGRGGDIARVRVLEGVAAYAGVAATYLLEPTDSDVIEAAEAQLDFRVALRQSGADSVSARAVGDVSPSALRAIARSIRSIPHSEG